jgi:O-acetylhomoserine (thiol)-lyase
MGITGGLQAEAYDRTYSDGQLLRRIGAYFRPHAGTVALVALVVALGSLAATVLPLLISRGINLLAGNPSAQTMLGLAGLVTVLGGLGWLFNFTRQWLGARAVGDVVLALRRDAMAAVLRRDMSFFDQYASGRIVSRVSSDTQDFATVITLSIDLLSQLVLVGVIAAVMLVVNWRLALLTISTGPVVVVVALVFRSIARRAMRQSQRAQAEVNAIIQETISGVAVAKSFRQEAAIFADFESTNNLAYRIQLVRVAVFGSIYPLMNTLAGLGIEVTFVDATDAKRVEEAVTPATRMVLVETIANPGTQVADMARIGALCKAKGLVYVVDNTLTSPYLFLPKSVQAAISINSLSKYFGGHGNALGGSVTDTGLFDWSAYPNIFDIYKKGNEPAMYAMLQIRKKGLRDFGGTLAPEVAHVLSVGSETLALRMDRACGNAARIALFLSTHPKVKKVNYPGLNAHPQNPLAKELFKRPGALLSFVLTDDVEPFAFLDRLKLAICSSNLGDNRTLIIPVAQTIYFEMGPARRASMGIEDGMIRLSVGIEDTEDLLEDFAQALG